MSKIKTLDNTTIDRLRDAINENMAEFAEEYGISIKAGFATIGLDRKQVTFKVECALISEDGVVQTKEATDFKAYAGAYGMKPTDLGREFMNRGARYKIVGLAAKARSMPIICEEVGSGKRFKFATTIASKLI